MKGYACVSASTVEEALSLWKREMPGPAPFRLALTDLCLGDGPGGVEFAAQVRELDPSALLIACSGDSTDPAVVDPGRFGFDGTLAKPFLFGTLLETLEQVVEGSADRAPGHAAAKDPAPRTTSRVEQ